MAPTVKSLSLHDATCPPSCSHRGVRFDVGASEAGDLLTALERGLRIRIEMYFAERRYIRRRSAEIRDLRRRTTHLTPKSWERLSELTYWQPSLRRLSDRHRDEIRGLFRDRREARRLEALR